MGRQLIIRRGSCAWTTFFSFHGGLNRYMLDAARLSTTLPITAPAPTSFFSAIFIDSSILVVAPTKKRYNSNNQSNNNEHVAPPRHGMVAPPRCRHSFHALHPGLHRQ